MNYLRGHGTRQTPQSEPIPGSTQVENSAGGYSWETDKWQRLQRFLILGSEGGSYYASERKLTTENVKCVRECLSDNAARTITLTRDISEAGRAPSNDPALYVMACAISDSDPLVRRWAAEALPRVARIGTHLYHFIAYAETMRGWGSTLRWAVSNWYTSKQPDKLAYEVIKYRQRDGWSHRDLLRLAHPKGSAEHNAIFDWITHQTPFSDEPIPGYMGMIAAFMEAQKSETTAYTAKLVREYRLPREALQTEHLNDPEVWRALLETGMPLTAMIRNLATMTRLGVFDGTLETATVIATLGSADKIRQSRVHPMTLLVALKTYAQGHGMRGQNAWVPKPVLIDALDEAFYTAFANVEPSGKRTVLALDISGSMAMGSVAGSPLTPREASAAMALVTLHAEDQVECVGFSHQLIGLALSKRQRLDDAVRTISNLPFGGTDCALPWQMARDDSMGPEAIITYTDSETWAGGMHPQQALRAYRERSGIEAKSVVCGMTSNGFTIADPNDPGSLDVVGFDTATPALIADFCAGRI